MNCWQFRDCGRERGGRRADEFGVCPAALFEPADGYLGGHNGGCACAFVAGTYCDGVLEGTYRDKSKRCWDCDFFRFLRERHGAAFSLPAFALHLAENNPEAYRAFTEQHRSGAGPVR